MNAQELISILDLQPHPEGGYYKETYRAAQIINDRNVSTAIFYLLEDKDRSHFHRIKSDELWFYHSGEPLELLMIQNDQITTIILGNDIANGQVLQAIIPANTWFAAKVRDGVGYSLFSCTVAPGFDFADFELAERQELLGQFPRLSTIIQAFTT